MATENTSLSVLAWAAVKLLLLTRYIAYEVIQLKVKDMTAIVRKIWVWVGAEGVYLLESCLHHVIIIYSPLYVPFHNRTLTCLLFIFVLLNSMIGCSQIHVCKTKCYPLFKQSSVEWWKVWKPGFSWSINFLGFVCLEILSCNTYRVGLRSKLGCTFSKYT